MKRTTPAIPLSLYIHFPWCVRKCPYCDFNSHALRETLPERDYLNALLRDLGEELATIGDRSIQSIFFGGGTPSLISPRTIEAVIDRVASDAVLESDAEITLEANPGASDRARFSGYRSAGVNRLSIGVQSFDDRLLRAIGRIHDARQARGALDAARTAGFDNVNLDIMFALPGQSLAQAAADIETAAGLSPEHISWYQLTIEPNTMFHHKPPPVPDEDEAMAMHQYGLERLRQGGWFRYEVSAFARGGRESRHNRNYWEFGDYLGAGAGAHGKITDQGRIVRYGKPRHPGDYINRGADFRTGVRAPTSDDLVFEFLLGALRLREGFALATFEQRTGMEAAVLEQRIAPLVESRLLYSANARVRATERGFWYLNEILERMLPDDDTTTCQRPAPA